MRIILTKGQSLVEVMLAVAVFVIGATALGVLAIDAGVSYRGAAERLKAAQYALEGLEAARSIRDRSLITNLTTGTRGLAMIANQWQLSGTSDEQDRFVRKLYISAPNSDLRYVTSSVSWRRTDGVTSTVSVATALSNWHAPNGNPKNSTLTGKGNLMPSLDNLAVAGCGDLAYVGRVNAVQEEFVVIDAAVPENWYQRSSLKVGGAVNSIALSGDCRIAYLAGGNGAQELWIVDIANPDVPTLLSASDLGGSGDATGVMASGTMLYITRNPSGSNPTFQIIDASSSTNPVIVNSLQLGDGAYDLSLSQVGTSYAFIAAQINNQEFQTVDITNPLSLTVNGGLDYPGNNDMYGAAVSGTAVFLGRRTGGGDEFQVADVTSPSAPVAHGSLGIGAHVNAVRTGFGYVFAVGASSTAEYIAIDGNDIDNPAVLSKIDLDNEANDVSATSDRVYVVGKNGMVAIITFL